MRQRLPADHRTTYRHNRGDYLQAEEAVGAAESSDPRAIAERMFRRLLVRTPKSNELDAIVEFFDSQKHHSEPWTLVARALINTDEAITVP
jgi:hypothetical protein